MAYCGVAIDPCLSEVVQVNVVAPGPLVIVISTPKVKHFLCIEWLIMKMVLLKLIDVLKCRKHPPYSVQNFNLLSGMMKFYSDAFEIVIIFIVVIIFINVFIDF